MTGTIATIPKFQFSSATGTPLANGTLTVYLAGTTTLTNTWQDYQLSSLNTNPVILDSRGECVLWFDPTVTYKLVLKNSSGVVQWTQDNLIGAGASAATLEAALAANSGSAKIGGGDQIVSSIASLRALIKTSSSKNAYVTGYYAAGDGGGGAYYYDATDTSTADNAGTVIVATDGGRWKRATIGSSIDIKNFGAKVDGTTDDTSAWINAVAYVSSFGGGTVTMSGSVGASSTSVITQTIVINNGDVKILGAGHGGWHDVGSNNVAASIVRWNGAAGGTMFKVEPSATSIQALYGSGVSGIFLQNGTSTAAYGVYTRSVRAGFWDFAGEEFSTALMYCGTLSTVTEAQDWQNNTVHLYGRQVVQNGATLYLDGTALSNVSFNDFAVIKANYKNGVAIQCVNSDNNVFTSLQLFRISGGTAVGVRLLGGASSAASVRNELFIDCSPGAGGFYAAGTETGAVVASGTNTIISYDKGNGPPDPVIGTGAVLSWGSNQVGIALRSLSLAPTLITLTEASGLVRQTGKTALIASNGSLVITLPITFSNSAVNVQVTPLTSPGSFAASANTTTLTISNGSVANTFSYLVEGY